MTNTLRFLLFLVLYLPAISSKAELRLEQVPIKSGKVAFTYTVKDQSDIYLLDFSTSTIRPLIVSNVADEYPVWSPNGKQLVFYSDRTGDREIFLAGADGGNIRQLTSSPGIDEDPDWSPDGTEIVFRSEREGKGSNLYLMKTDGSNVRQITEGKKINSVPRWSPTGKQILYSTNIDWPGWDIMLLNLETKARTQVTKGIRTFCHASWNPDGTSFIFSSGGGNSIDLWIEELGKPSVRVTDREGREYDAVFKDKTTIIYVAELNKGAGDYQLFLMNLQTKKSTQITSGDGAIRDPSWTN